MAAYVKYQCFVENLAEKVHNLGADALKIALTNTAPNVATHTVLADITEIGAGGGYPAGGNAPAITSSTQAAGVYKLVLADTVFTATTGFGPFRYAVLYNSTAAGGPLIAYHDYGSSISALALETFTWDADPTTGVLTIT